MPKKNNPVMDKMETRAQERERKRREILQKKQAQKEAEEQQKIQEEKQRVSNFVVLADLINIKCNCSLILIIGT